MNIVTIDKRIADVFDRLRNRSLELSLSRHDDKRFKKVLRGITALEAAADKILAPLEPAKTPLVLSTPDRITSLTAALQSIAIDKGAALLPRDRLKSLIVDAASGAAKLFWHNESDGQPIGFIGSSRSFRNGLKALGVLVWIFDRDMQVRLINTNWLHLHRDIFEYVNSEAQPGKRCRFCRIEEPPESTQLVRIRPEASDGIQTHQPCAEHWLRFEKIAAQYPNLDAAIAADKATAREVSEKPAPGLLTEQVA